MQTLNYMKGFTHDLHILELACLAGTKSSKIVQKFTDL